MKQAQLILASILALVATGCESLQSKPTAYVIAVGDPIEFIYTGLLVDHCPDEPTPNPGELTCITHGEIYSGTFSNLRVLGGTLGFGTSRIGVLGHALLKDQRGAPTLFMILERAPQDVRDATGLEYITADRQSADPEACFLEDIEAETGVTLSNVRRRIDSNGWHCYEPS